MEESLKVHDCVQLMHGYTPTMTISSINEETQTANCVWYDTKARKTKVEVLPLNVLKKYKEPEPVNMSALMNSLKRL